MEREHLEHKFAHKPAPSPLAALTLIALRSTRDSFLGSTS
jgi:hypothetical protein